MRADQLLVLRGLAASRSQAQRLIAAGVRWRLDVGGQWQSVRKNGEEIPAQAQLQLVDDAEKRYVSRGGLKLEGALAASGLSVRGLHCVDIGQSTGGFTDCLLQHGAAYVCGVDVGQGQLHPDLRADTRIQVYEKINARDGMALRTALGHTQFDVAVADVSFISLTLVLPAVVPVLRPGGHVLMLVKPQFELQPDLLGKGGIVRDANLFAVVEQRIRTCCADVGVQVLRWLDSPITGGDGNREFFVFGQYSPVAC